MKKLSIILLFTFCSQYLLAQAQPEMKPNQKRLDKYLGKDEPRELIAGHWPLKPLKSLNPSDTATFSHTTVQGSIYYSGTDNMPCLRPDATVYRNDQIKMVKVLPLGNNMPNAFKSNPLVWDKKP